MVWPLDTGLYVSQSENKIKLNTEIHFKALNENIKIAYEIINEVILKTKFDNEKRLKELLEELKLRMNRRIVSSGDSVARLRAMSYYSKAYYLRDQIAGLAFYEFISDIVDNFNEKKDEVIAMLYDTVKKVFVKDNMILNFAGDGENFEKVKEYTVDLKKNMFDSSDDFKEQFDGWKFVPQQKNEAIVTSGQVQYVTMAGNYNDEGEKEEYDGSFFVLGNIMRNKYLWNNIREKGGAYGCNCVIGKTGDGFFSSYRDPKLKESVEVYKKAPEFIENFNVDEREMRKYIIGTISLLDTPLNAADISGREFTNYMAGVSYESLCKTRLKVLATTPEDIRNLAPKVKKIIDRNNICVVGSKSAIEGSRELFKEIKELR